MKYFPLLVQERKAIIPAPVWEVAAHAAAPPSALPSRLSVVSHGKFDCESSCFSPKVLSEMSYSLATAGENLPFTTPLLSACTQKGKNKIMLPEEHNLVAMKSLLDLSVCIT